MSRKICIVIMVVLLAVPVLARPILDLNSPAPAFVLPDLNGQNVSLEKYLGREAIVLGFFASWSNSSQQELAFLQELHQGYRNKGLKAIGVSYDRKLKVLEEYVTENQLGFTIVHDQKLKTLKDYRILIIPTLFVIDREGMITSIYVDFDENVETAVAKEVRRLLAPPY